MATPTIVITDLSTEQVFTDYFQRRAVLRDEIRFGVYPNLTKFLADYAAFLADYGPGGALYNAEIWAYYQAQIAPIAAYQAQMISAAEGIVSGLVAIEQTAPGTFGIDAPPAPAPAPAPSNENP